MAFDWISFFRSHGISYVDRGPNVARGNVNIRCPFCGASDPSQHMGVSLQSGRWGCWRNRRHSGRSPVRLIRQLIGCSWEQAEVIAGKAVVQTDIDLNVLRKQLDSGGSSARSVRRALDRRDICRDHFLRRIKPEGVRGRYFDYLVSRGFAEEDVLELCRMYGLRCCLVGDHRRRVIFPFRRDADWWYGFTGRTLDAAERIRYKSWPADGSVKRRVYNQDQARAGGRVLVVVEGPIDTLKVDFYGRAVGIRAVGLLGVSTSAAQHRAVIQLAAAYERTLVLLDANAVGPAMSLVGHLAPCRPLVGLLREAEDPGELRPDQVERAVERCLRIPSTLT